MAASIIAIGNPGAGKSTILNSLAGELLFKSGISFGAGLTYKLEEQENKRGRFLDTPGLTDDTLREAASKAISTALRKGGDYKILFFVRLESGRLVREDITTFKLVLQSAPEIGNKYGIVTNKLPLNVAKGLQNPDNAAQVLTKLFASIPEENRCAPSSITYLTYNPEADSVNNYLLDLGDLKTLEGTYFVDFVYGQIETVCLTAGKANDIKVEDYDKTTSTIEALLKTFETNQQMFIEEQRRMREQHEKAEKEKDERFNQQLESLKMKIEDAKTNSERQLLENEKDELAAYRKRNQQKLLRKNMTQCSVM